jgi:CheY-like chemotaxis protein
MDDASVGGTYRPSILVVEDDPLLASYIKEVLTEAEFRIAGLVSSAAEALALLEHERPDLALVDIQLTGPLDGIELACLLQLKAHIPAIFLSGLTDPKTKLKAAAARPLAFLHKPFRPSTLFNTIEQATGMTASC